MFTGLDDSFISRVSYSEAVANGRVKAVLSPHKCYQNAFLLNIILAFLFTDPVDELLPREGNDIFISTSFRGAAEPV